MGWKVQVTKKVAKAIPRLPQRVQKMFAFLAKEIELEGPVLGNWPNYGKLGPRRHHCHLKKGQPTYVAVWEEEENQIQLVEVIYVGTHEKAPY